MIAHRFPDPSDTLGMTCAGMLMVEGEKRDGSGKIARPYTRLGLCGIKCRASHAIDATSSL